MQKYDEAFKKMIVALSESGKTIKELSEEYAISPASINNWKKLYKSIKISDANKEEINLSEYKKLQKEMAKLQEENEVLKKCVSIFSKK